MRIRVVALAILMLFGTAAPSAAAPVLNDVIAPTVTDESANWVGFDWKTDSDECYYPSLFYRVDGGEWKDIHPTRSKVFLPVGVLHVDFRVVDSCGASTGIVSKVIEVLPPGGLSPVIDSFTVPSTATGAQIEVSIDSSPARAGMPDATRMRFATEDGVWRDWIDYHSTLNAPVSDGLGYKALFVQLSDGYHESAPQVRYFTRVQSPSPTLAASYRGWATVLAITNRPTWRWTTNGWANMSPLNPGTRVYALPFSRGWHWVWYANAWHAIKSSSLTSA